MAEFDYNSFSQSLDEYKKFVNNKHWADLTESETFYVEDKEKLKISKFRHGGGDFSRS